LGLTGHNYWAWLIWPTLQALNELKTTALCSLAVISALLMALCGSCCRADFSLVKAMKGMNDQLVSDESVLICDVGIYLLNNCDDLMNGAAHHRMIS